jgi:hypothetical protein
MPSLSMLLVYAFYGATFLALLYFVHSVLWIARFRKLQQRLAEKAEEELSESGRESSDQWRSASEKAWNKTRGQLSDASPENYVRRVEQALARLTLDLRSARLEGAFQKALREDLDLTEDVAPGEDEVGGPRRVRTRVEVLHMPRLFGDPIDVALEVGLGRLRRMRRPDPHSFDLRLKSRYGTKRRLLVFLFGAADVAFSARHVSRISQHATMPMSVIFRRLSLVLLILLAVLVDVSLGIRKRLIDISEQWLGNSGFFEGWGGFGEFLDQYLPVTLALIVWLAGYGTIYVGLFLYLWFKSKSYLRRLERLREEDHEKRESLFARYEAEFCNWVLGFARSLDEATGNTASQARLLVERTLHQLRQRVAHPLLVEHAEQTAAKLFEMLPEASTQLQDEVTTQHRSLRFRLWPLASDMRDQTVIARRRFAWQYLQTAVAELRGSNPDPAVAIDLWARMIALPPAMPEIELWKASEELASAYPVMLAELVEQTERDLVALDTELTELAESLGKSFDNVQSLIDTRYDLARQAMGAELGELTAEILRVRERARLEAMAFEI